MEESSGGATEEGSLFLDNRYAVDFVCTEQSNTVKSQSIRMIRV